MVSDGLLGSRLLAICNQSQNQPFLAVLRVDKSTPCLTGAPFEMCMAFGLTREDDRDEAQGKTDSWTGAAALGDSLACPPITGRLPQAGPSSL